MAANDSLANIDLTLHWQQGVAYQSQATEILYGGAAGGGKSHLMRVAAVCWCYAIPGLQVYLFRRISEDLVKNHIEGPKGLRAMLAPWVLAGFCTIVEDEIRFWNGSKIYLCHCKDEKDRFKYLGAEIHVLLIDELTTFTDVIYRFLRSRCRAVGLKVPPPYLGMFPRILAGSNPGGVGHHWVKWAFIDGAQPLALRPQPDSEGGMVRQYIPAKLDDNPSMQTDDPTYRARLRGLGSPELVKAMEEGDWNVVAGAFFHEWHTPRHVIAPLRPHPTWTVFKAFDWGSARPFSVGWYAIAGGEALPDGRRYARGTLIRWREWYGVEADSPNQGLRLHAEVVGDGIRAREADFPSLGIKCAYSVCDPSAFAEDGGPSIVERMGVAFQPADNKRVPGWDQVRARLSGEDGVPMLLITAECVHAIRTLPSLQSDDIKLDDVDTEGEDHAADEIRYACMSRPYARPLPRVPAGPKLLQTATFDELMAAYKPRRRERV
jgi:hypothetical protein